MKDKMVNLATSTGRVVFRLIHIIGEFTLLLWQTICGIFVPPYKFERIFIQAWRIGPGSFFIASIVSFFIGMIMALQMAYQMVTLSAEIYIPNIVSVSITRELAPVLTALIVAGRMGAGMTAEIGSMVVTEQVEALKAFACNPVKYLVVPRFLSMIMMLPLLTIFADMIGILGGFMICVYKLDVSPAMYLAMMAQSLVVKDIITGLVKTVFFGAIIALVGCYYGLNVKGGAEGVGKSTTRSVVVSFILIIMCDCLFTTVFYFVFKM